jgi:serine/threonine-protein kinase
VIGRTLSHEKILAEISRGMGIVYRAVDVKLDREAALQVLPDVFTENEERVALFEHEAQRPVSLNHPNMAAIHELLHPWK